MSPKGAWCCAGGAASRRPGARGRAPSVDQPFNAGTQSPCASSRSSTRSEISLERQLGRRVRIEHRRVLGVVLAAGDDRLDRQLLHVDVGLHQRRELRRQAADADRLDAVVVDQARHLDAGAVGQVVDVAAVLDVAVDDDRLAGHLGEDDAGGIFVAALHLHPLVGGELLLLARPSARSAPRSGGCIRRAGC